jgi:transcriptional regulator with XRE-family HTH domain
MAGGAAVRDELPLADLRARRLRTQAQLAEAIGTTQSAVSRLERQQDILISTLRDYVIGTGGRLRLLAEYPDGSVNIYLPVLGGADEAGSDRVFRVIWHNVQTRQFVHVGWLRSSGALFTFRYTADAELESDFEPFAPFPNLREAYRSSDLFPFFADRVASAARPGFGDLASALGLDRAEATPVELLARSWGKSSHDTIQVVPEPTEEPDGTQTRFFLVSGARHVDEDRPDRIAKLIMRLKRGRRLTLRDEPDNPFNSQAIVLDAGRHQVGWMPDYLVDEIHKARAGGATIDVGVDQANGPGTPWHLRLLCRLEVRPRP